LRTESLFLALGKAATLLELAKQPRGKAPRLRLVGLAQRAGKLKTAIFSVGLSLCWKTVQHATCAEARLILGPSQ
jgi:hypothetical protein